MLVLYMQSIWGRGAEACSVILAHPAIGSGPVWNQNDKSKQDLCHFYLGLEGMVSSQDKPLWLFCLPSLIATLEYIDEKTETELVFISFHKSRCDRGKRALQRYRPTTTFITGPHFSKYCRTGEGVEQELLPF